MDFEKISMVKTKHVRANSQLSEDERTQLIEMLVFLSTPGNGVKLSLAAGESFLSRKHKIDRTASELGAKHLMYRKGRGVNSFTMWQATEEEWANRPVRATRRTKQSLNS